MEVKKSSKKANRLVKLRDYLNSEESNHFLFLKIMALHMKTYRQNWEKFGNISNEEHKYLKLTESWLNKFIDTMESRLSEKQRETFKKKQYKYAIKVLDEYTLNRLEGKFKGDLQVVKMEGDDFFDIFVPEAMDGMCKNCNKDYKTCKWHDVLQKYFVIESDENLPNCRYAYTRDIRSDRYKMLFDEEVLSKFELFTKKFCDDIGFTEEQLKKLDDILNDHE
jgi:hypothetical protein